MISLMRADLCLEVISGLIIYLLGSLMMISLMSFDLLWEFRVNRLVLMEFLLVSFDLILQVLALLRLSVILSLVSLDFLLKGRRILICVGLNSWVSLTVMSSFMFLNLSSEVIRKVSFVVINESYLCSIFWYDVSFKAFSCSRAKHGCSVDRVASTLLATTLRRESKSERFSFIQVSVNVEDLNCVGTCVSLKDPWLTHVTVHGSVLPNAIFKLLNKLNTVVQTSDHDSRPPFWSIRPEEELEISLGSLDEAPVYFSVAPLISKIHSLAILLERLKRGSLQVSVELIISTPSVSVLAAVSHYEVQSSTSVFVINQGSTLAPGAAWVTGVDSSAVSTDLDSSISATVVAILKETHSGWISDGSGQIGAIVIRSLLDIESQVVRVSYLTFRYSAASVGIPYAVEVSSISIISLRTSREERNSSYCWDWDLFHLKYYL